MFRCCTKCGVEKPITEFNLERGKPRAYCKTCHAAAALAWARANRERRREISNAYTKRRRARLGPPKKGGGVRKFTPEEAARRDNECKLRWRLNNPAKVLAKTRQYQAKKLKAFPRWADKSSIEAIYEKARAYGMHVDHIVPLQSKIVCGLHWEGNLQLLPPSENRRKHNSYWPDMPHDV